MADFEQELEKLMEQTKKFQNIEFQHQGRTVEVDMSGVFQYLIGYAGGLAKGCMLRAEKELDARLAGRYALMFATMTIDEGTKVMEQGVKQESNSSENYIW